jgi:hypothetical protein
MWPDLQSYRSPIADIGVSWLELMSKNMSKRSWVHLRRWHRQLRIT